MPTTPYLDHVERAVKVFVSLQTLEPQVTRAARILLDALGRGNKVLVCGNGGSACEAQHLAAELVGNYRRPVRRSLPGIALTADTGVLTSVGNDNGFDNVFSRQVEGLGVSGDVLVVFSTSGNSENLIRALQTAQVRGLQSIAFLGRDGGRAYGIAGCEIIVPADDTPRIQEAHQFLLHAVMDLIEAALREPR